MEEQQANITDIKFFKNYSLSLNQCTCINDLMKTLVSNAKSGCQTTHWGIYDLIQDEDDRLKMENDKKLTPHQNESILSLNISEKQILETLKHLINLKDEFDRSMSFCNINQENFYFFILPELENQSKLVVFRLISTERSIIEKLECLINFAQIQSLSWKQLKIAEKRLNTDDLTGVFNHRFLEPAIEAELKRASRFNEEFSVLFIDLDNFKSVNDIYGHLSGSSVLVQVANVFKTLLREIDFVFRYGGDEFVIILLGAGTESASSVAERIRLTINNTALRVESGETIKLSVSIGIASYPRHGYDRKSLLDIADKAMYQSKKSGKNKVQIYDQLNHEQVEQNTKEI